MPTGRNPSESLEFVFQSPTTGKNLRDALVEGFDSNSYNRLRILAATVSERGVDKIEDQLVAFCDDGGEVEIYIGLSMGPDPEGIRRLKDLQDRYPGLVSIKLIRNSTGVNLFHPKVYWFRSDGEHRVILGSPNWSQLGFENNVEAFSIVTESTAGEQSEFITGVRSAFGEIRELNESTDSWGTLHSPSEHILEQLESMEESYPEEEQSRVDVDTGNGGGEGLWPLSRTSPELVMELNRESRMSQIVPPNEIWGRYFGVDTELFREEDPDLPIFNLRNVTTDDHSRRPVVDHDHQGSIEIPEANNRKDPAIQSAFLVFRKTGAESFDYQLFLEGEDEEAAEIEEFLNTYGNAPGRSSRLTFIAQPN